MAQPCHLCAPHTMFSTDAFGRLALNPVFWVPRLLSALICFLSPARLWFPSLILLDWKNRANMVWSAERALMQDLSQHPHPPPPYGLNWSLNLFPINVSWIFRRATYEAWAGKQKASESSLWWRVMSIFSFFVFIHFLLPSICAHMVGPDKTSS